MSSRVALLDAQDSVDRAVEAARSAGSIALDTEFMRERTYTARLCLLQLEAGDTTYVIDPLKDIDLKPVAELLADPAVEVIVHAGRQDLELFYELFDVLPRSIFDVQLAAGFAGYGANLPYGRLVEALLDRRLHKGESYSDWCKRPLTSSQLEYAADDVRYLPAMARSLKQRIDELGRKAWVEEEMALLESEELYISDPSQAWRRVSGRGALSGRQLSVLHELAAWREDAARRRNLPRGWVVKDQTLVDIARRQPHTIDALRGIRGLNDKEAQRSGRDILAAVQRGLEGPPVQMPPAPSRSTQARVRMLGGLADAVVRARCEQSDVATELVATRGELEALLADAITGDVEASRHRLMQGWRAALAGDAVIELARGRIAVKASDDPPFVEEISL